MLIVAALAGLLSLVIYRWREEARRGTTKDPAWYKDKAVFITGCDSGLGLSLAQYCHTAGLVVVAACHTHSCSQGADILQHIGNKSGRLVVIRDFDVTDPACVREAREKVSVVLRETGTVLRAVVNNAAVLVLANFEWQTSQLIETQIKVEGRGGSGEYQLCVRSISWDPSQSARSLFHSSKKIKRPE